MPEPQSDLTTRAQRLPGLTDGTSPPPSPARSSSADDTPTVISKALPRPASADEALNSLRGRHLAHFELLEAIGVGGMAAVLRARDTQLDRIVALKILPPEMANDPENIQRFHQEARSAAKLDHENIARVFFCGEDQRLHFIAFEFVEGDNLRTILERRGRLPVGEALHYMLQIAAGLSHAAARGVVHRDIKPSNIIITPNGRAKLVDMGLARSLERQDDKGLTHSGVTLGTFDYISPEQALEPRDADVRSDIYSLGCTFYHALTGQPPVPEGTAAKKLHHHQHVKPTDPRELAAHVSDDAAMILARMMAKNPRDRYQTPEHLFQELWRAAHKLGSPAEVPESVLAVEASLPPASSHRPMLVVAAAAAAVVVLVLLLVPSVTAPSGGKKPNPQRAAKNDLVVVPSDNNPKDAVKDKDPVKEIEPSHVARYDDPDVTPQKLVSWLHEHNDAEQVEISLARDLELPAPRDEADHGLVVKANKVILRAKDPKRRPTIWCRSGPSKQSARAAFTIDSKDATVEGIRIVLDGRDSPEAMTGLLFVGGGRSVVKHCEFIQARETLDEKQRLTSVLYDNATSSSDGVRSLSECVFLGFDSLETVIKEEASDRLLLLKGPERGGQDAILRRGPGRLEVEQCAFGPHAAALRFEGDSSSQNTVLMTHCSVLAAPGSTVFYFLDDATAQLDVSYSLFSRPSAALEGRDTDGAYLIRQTGAARSAVSYHDLDNRYHNLDGFWSGEAHDEMTYQEFQTRLQDSAGPEKEKNKKTGSRVLTTSPWQAASPLALLVKEPSRAFPVQFGALRKPLGESEEEQLKPVFQVRLDQSDLRLTGRETSLIGVESLGDIQYASKLPPPSDRKTEVANRHTLIVDPSVTEMKIGPSDQRIYPSLTSALEFVRPGDLILIRHTGELETRPLILEDPLIDLTIRPDADQKPILVLGKTIEADATLFKLHDGKLRLEGLEVRLQPAHPRFRSQAVVTLVGDGQCTLVNCVLTLDPTGLETPLAAVTLADNTDVMKMKVQQPALPSPSPRLVFDNCFVRGKGDLIWSRVSRPFDLELKNSLVALEGNVLNVEVAETAPMVMGSSNVNVSVSHTTAYLAGHFLRLKTGKDLKGLVPVQCDASQALFVAASNQSFIHLDGPETSEQELLKKLPWSGKKNVYGGYTDMVTQQPLGEEPPPPLMKTDRWKMFSSDKTSASVARVKFTNPPGDTAFPRLLPAMFKAMDYPAVGPDLQQVPQPGER
jgi:serine/threonine protein kinase